MALVFISHSSQDNEKTAEIYGYIEDSGIDFVFLDYHEKNGIQFGEEWEKRLYHEILRSQAVVILLSPAWVASKWCFAEYQQAKALGKEIIPIIIDRGEDGEIDEWIASHIQKCDFTEDPNVIDRVIGRIKEIAIDTQKGFLWDKHRSPYPGLISYEEEDAAIFFGREEETREIIEKLNAMSNKNNPKFLNIVAASGLGKSSLLKAGVLARLRLIYQKRWSVLPVMRPMQRPLFELSKLFARFLNKKEDYKEIYNRLFCDRYQQYIDDIITEIEFMSDQKSVILLPVDQAEEFYSIAKNEEREAFFRVVEYLFLQKDNFYMIWTLRADYLKEFQVDKSARVLHKYEDIFSLDALAKENIGTIIKKPAEITGVVFDEYLIEKLKEDIQTMDALPLLALTLYELYNKYGQYGQILLKDYNALAKDRKNPLENIVQKKADEAIAEYKTDSQSLQALKDAFIPHLVRINEKQNGYIQREANWSDLPIKSHDIIEQLVEARLLIKTNKDGKNRVEISHEALIRTWSMLKEWLAQEQEFLIGKSQLEISLTEWKKIDDKEKYKGLLSGIRLEKALEWKDKLTNKDEIEFINQSLKHAQDLQKRRRNFLIGAFSLVTSFGIFSAWQWQKAGKSEKQIHQKSILLQKEINRAKHNIGLFFAEKAIGYLGDKKLARAHLYVYYALS